MKTAAIYARVSSTQQKEEKTINSQTAALVAFAKSEGYSVPDEWIFEDAGYSGASLSQTGAGTCTGFGRGGSNTGHTGARPGSAEP